MSVKIKQDNNAADIGLDEQNPIFQAWRELKDSIFNVLFVLLDKNDDDGDESMFGLIFQSGLDYLQMMVFPFQVAVITVWNGGETLSNVTNIFTKLNVSTYLPGINFSTFLIMVYVLIAMIIMVIVDIIYVSYSFSKKKFRFTWPLVLLAQIVPLFVTVLFLPITETLFSVVQCQSDPELGKQVMTSFPQVICWQGWHLFHAVITLLFTSIFVFISSIVGIALFEPRMTTNKLTARQNSTGQIVFIINKIVTQFVFSFTPFEDTWIYCIMLFCLSGWLFWTYNMHDPYYEKNASKFFRITSTYYFWTNFMLMVSQVLLSTGFNGGLVIWLCGLPFIWMVIVFDKQSNIDKLFSSNLKFRSGQDLEAHLKYVLQLIQNREKDKNSYMLLIGYIEKHKEVCTEEDCPLKVYKKKHNNENKENIEMQDNTIQLIKQLQRMYILGIKKYPICTKLRLSFAFFYLQRTKNKKKAYEEFSNAEKTDPAFEEQFIIYRFKKIIRQNLQDNNQNNSDLIEIIRFDNHISLCEEAMVFSARLHKQFWLELKEEIPDLKKLNNIGSKITQTVNTVRENYKEIQKINNSVPQVLHNYALYQMLIQQNARQGKQIMAIAKKIYQQKLTAGEKVLTKQYNLDNIDEDDGAIIVVSGKSSSAGKIVKINLLFIELSGFPKEELADRNIQKILPECMIGHHDYCINQWLKNQDNSSRYMSVSNKGFLRHKSGFIIPVTYKMKYHSEQEQFLVVFQQDTARSSQCHLITDSQGNIIQNSTMGYTYFSLDKIKLTQNLFNVSDLGFQNPLFDAMSENMKLGISKDSQTDYAVNVRPIKMKTNTMDNMNQNDQQDQKFLVKEKRVIGFEIEIARINKDRRTYIEERQVQSLSVDPDAIMDLYGAPQMIDVLALELNKTEHKQAYEFINYGQRNKIKTMRLTNNEIKMVYNQDSDDYFDQNGNEDEYEDEYQMMKIDDENYQKKIYKAINTNLNHKEISKLRWVSFGFLFFLCVTVAVHLLMTTQQLDDMKLYLKTILYKTEQTDFLISRISNTFAYNFVSKPVSPASEIQLIQNHAVEYQYPINVSLLLQDGSVVDKKMKDAMIFMESQISQFAQWRNPSTINNIFYNYINNIYPALEQNSQTIQINLIFSYALLAIAALLGVFMLSVWVYIMLLIDKKRYDIMIWFLDIPIPYVGFLGNHCDKYLKTFVGIKQLMEKGLKLDQQQYYIQGYSEKKDQNEQEIEQQQKTRKSLIARHKKATLLSKLDCSYIKFTWVVFYSVLFSIIVLITSMTAVEVFQFLQPQLVSSYRNLLWGGSLDIGFYIDSQYKTPIVNTSIPEFISQVKGNYLNTISGNDLIQFNNKIFNFSLPAVSQSFNNVYLNNLCNGTNNVAYCESILDGKLKGGYSIFAKYIFEAEILRKDEFRVAQRQYLAPSLVSMIKTWQSQLETQISKTLSLSSITMYIYIIVSLLGFLVIWMLYLRKLNTQINQTIQMLNMIPLKLLPKSRKQTKQFISWIIKEANKKQHQQQ